jgi:pre-B lymphocyte gene
VQWSQQKPESSPRFLLRFYLDSDKLQSTGVPAVLLELDTSANSALLHISGVQIENKAEYYCLIGYNSVLHFDTGNGEVGKIPICSGLWTVTFPKF